MNRPCDLDFTSCHLAHHSAVAVVTEDAETDALTLDARRDASTRISGVFVTAPRRLIDARRFRADEIVIRAVAHARNADSRVNFASDDFMMGRHLFSPYDSVLCAGADFQT